MMKKILEIVKCLLCLVIRPLNSSRRYQKVSRFLLFGCSWSMNMHKIDILQSLTSMHEDESFLLIFVLLVAVENLFKCDVIYFLMLQHKFMMMLLIFEIIVWMKHEKASFFVIKVVIRVWATHLNGNRVIINDISNITSKAWVFLIVKVKVVFKNFKTRFHFYFISVHSLSIYYAKFMH